jgi:xanthosine utilization system XapX-like protein
VHAAAILTLAVLGFWMLRGGPLLVPLLALYGVLGIYLGRDLARAKRLKAPRAFRGRLEQHGKPVPRS